MPRRKGTRGNANARAGLRVALVQDRPVLGGNASKEIRVPPVGAVNCNFAANDLLSGAKP